MKAKALLLCLIPVLLMGCWNAEEITDLVIVLAAGIDQMENGRIKLSLQVPITEELLPISGSPQLNKKSFAVLTAEGESVLDAAPILQSKTQLTLFLGQLKTVLLEAELAARGIKSEIDGFRRHPDIPPQAYVFLVKGKTAAMLNHSLWHKRLPGSSLVSCFRTKGKRDQSYEHQVWELARNISLPTQDAYLPILEYDEDEETFVIKGLGVFHKDRLVGELSGEEARMFGFLSGLARNAYLTLTIPEYGLVTVRQVRTKAKVGYKKNGTAPVITIDVKARGILGESTKMAVMLSQEDYIKIKGAVEAYLIREMQKTLQKIQALGADILALGEVYRIHNPLVFEASLWERLYPQIPVQVSVELAVENYGVLR